MFNMTISLKWKKLAGFSTQKIIPGISTLQVSTSLSGLSRQHNVIPHSEGDSLQDNFGYNSPSDTDPTNQNPHIDHIIDTDNDGIFETHPSQDSQQIHSTIPVSNRRSSRIRLHTNYFLNSVV